MRRLLRPDGRSRSRAPAPSGHCPFVRTIPQSRDDCSLGWRSDNRCRQKCALRQRGACCRRAGQLRGAAAVIHTHPSHRRPALDRRTHRTHVPSPVHRVSPAAVANGLPHGRASRRQSAVGLLVGSLEGARYPPRWGGSARRHWIGEVHLHDKWCLWLARSLDFNTRASCTSGRRGVLDRARDGSPQ